MEHMLNQTGCDAVPSQEPSLEVVNNNAMSTRDSITDIEQTIQRIEDFLQGSSPEKGIAGGGVESCPAGMLATLCQIGANNHDRLMEIHKRLARVASSLGVSQ